MKQLGDFHVKSSSKEIKTSTSINSSTLIIIAVVLTIVGLSVYWFSDQDIDNMDTPPQEITDFKTPQPLPLQETVNERVPELPLLDDSDSLVRDLINALSSNPKLAAWFIRDNLIRRFVVAVDNFSDGRNPSQHVEFMRPSEQFIVDTKGPKTQIDPKSYSRYDDHAQIINSLDTQGTAQLYLSLEPLINEAYLDLGYPDRKFRNTLERAIEKMLAAPIVEDSPVIVKRGIFYEYENESLELLSPAQKQFLSMGPRNMQTVKLKALAIAEAINLKVNY